MFIIKINVPDAVTPLDLSSSSFHNSKTKPDSAGLNPKAPLRQTNPFCNLLLPKSQIVPFCEGKEQGTKDSTRGNGNRRQNETFWPKQVSRSTNQRREKLPLIGLWL
jgi:hypothetical protein